MTNPHGDRGHATLGGSSALRWTNCPGSVFYIKELPPQATTEAATEGTEAHELAEKVLKNFLDHKVDGVDLMIPAHDDADMLDAAIAYKDAIWTKVLEEMITGKAYGVEDQVTLDKDLEMFGYIDFWAVYIDDHGKRTGVIADFKYGFNKVSVEKNAQLAFYSCALREEMRSHGKDLDRVRAIIFQPRAYGCDPYKETQFTAKQLDEWKKKFYKAANSIFVEKKPTYKVGEWCRFCPAQAVCAKYNKELTAKTALKFADRSIDVLPTPDRLSDEQLVNILRNAEAIESFVSSCKKYAMARHIEGKPLTGMKVVETKGRRKWLDNEEEVIKSLKALGLTEITKEKLKGIGDIEKQAKLLPNKDNVLRGMASLIQVSSGAKTLVPDEDSRPEASIGVAKFSIT